MLTNLLEGLLKKYLGQYLELSETSINWKNDIVLYNVKLKESVFSDLGLPIKCVHGKVSKLVIKVPWFNIMSKSTEIEIDGLHLLVVPSTSVRYDEKNERKIQFEAKQKRLQKAEDLKLLNVSNDSKNDTNSSDDQNDPFFERLAKTIIKNLEVTIANVHIRYEDKQSNPGYPFAAGVTLANLVLTTTKANQEEEKTLTYYGKKVILNSFSVYWKPKAEMLSEEIGKRDDEVIFKLFDDNIGTKEKPCTKLKYLLGPISSDAELELCLSPEKFQYHRPMTDLKIHMEELCVQLTKFQYYNFMMLLQSLEYMSRASQFRKYKARFDLENLPNYSGKAVQLWKFGYWSILEEFIVKRKLSWSWDRIKEHCKRCKDYRSLYKKKILSKTLTEEYEKARSIYPAENATILKNISEDVINILCLEEQLDEFNITIQRGLADKEIKEEKENEASTGWFGGWFNSKSKTKSVDKENVLDKLDPEEKTKLYELMDYQENVNLGYHPKSFIANKAVFHLDSLKITIRNEDLHNVQVLQLTLNTVSSEISQRPSAKHFAFSMTMEALTITGLKSNNSSTIPTIVKTKMNNENITSNLLAFNFEKNPPENPNAMSDEEWENRSLYDQKIAFRSSALEIIYDRRTINALISLFQTPDEIDLAILQQQAFAKLQEYKEYTAYNIQWVIENHPLIKVDVNLSSNIIIIPMSGIYTENCQCSIVSLGKISIKTRPISSETKDVKNYQKNKSQRSIGENIAENILNVLQGDLSLLQEKAYDKFDMRLENIQILVALPNENWRQELDQKKSPLFLLTPTTISVSLKICMITDDPNMAKFIIEGALNRIQVNISDYRFLRLVQIVDSLNEPETLPVDSNAKLRRTDSNSSFGSAKSSLGNTASWIGNNLLTDANLANIPVEKAYSIDEKLNSNAPKKNSIQLQLSVNIHQFNFKMSQQSKSKMSNEDEDIFDFVLDDMSVNTTHRNFDLTGKFHIGDITCTHLLIKTPNGEDVKMLRKKAIDPDSSDEFEDAKSFFGNSNNNAENYGNKLLEIDYIDVKKNSPELANNFGNILKNIKIDLAKVNIIIHQDAILHLVEKITKFTTEVESKLKYLNFNAANPDLKPNSPIPSQNHSAGTPNKTPQNSRKPLKRQLSRKLSFQTAGNVAKWSGRAKLRHQKSLLAESMIANKPIDLKIEAKLKSVLFQLMTNKVNLAQVEVKNLRASWTQTKENKEITAKLIDFIITDETSGFTSYKKIAECKGDSVFDAKIMLFDHDNLSKSKDLNLVDLSIVASMGRIKFVYLHKFVTDILTFIDPFSNAKEFVAEKAENALEATTKTMAEAYASQTRAKLDIHMKAPLIIIPVDSRTKLTLLADLGTLHLSNKFIMENSYLIDDMQLSLEDIALSRSKISDDVDSNRIESIIPLLSFDSQASKTVELSMRRNMGGSKTKNDPPEFKICGRLYEIKLDLSRGDYNVIMEFLLKNFNEKGVMEIKRPQQDLTKTNKGLDPLPLKPRYHSGSGSRTSLSSRSSGKGMKEALTEVERDPDCRTVEFTFIFHGIKGELFSGLTDLSKTDRDPAESLACVQIQKLNVFGYVNHNGSVVACARLQNLTLEDSREISKEKHKCFQRLIDSKCPLDKMIEANINRDPEGNLDVEVVISSITLVGSIKYLVDLGMFFQPDSELASQWQKESLKDLPDAIITENTEPPNETKMTVFVKMEEPDIFLVEDISDPQTEALVFNTELQLKLWMVGEAKSMMASLTNIRGNTCKFDPKQRETSKSEILSPCTLSFNISSQNPEHMKIQCNMSDLCLNVSPRSIQIIMKSANTFMESMQENDISDLNNEASSIDEDFNDIWKAKRYDFKKFWFLKQSEDVPEGTEATEQNTLSSANTYKSEMDQQAILMINNVIIKIESADVGHLPLLRLESSISLNIQDFYSKRMSMIGSLNLKLDYYNAKLALWEPIIEPKAETRKQKVMEKKWDLTVTLQQNASSDFGSALMSPNLDETDFVPIMEQMPPLMVLSFTSTEILEITITKTLVQVLNTLATSWSEISAFSNNFDEVDSIEKRKETNPPYVVKNNLGKTVTLVLDSNKEFRYYLFGSEDNTSKTEQQLLPNEEVALILCKNPKYYTNSGGAAKNSTNTELITHISSQDQNNSETFLKIKVKNEPKSFDISVSKADQRFFPFKFRGDEQGFENGFVSEISVENGTKFISLKSILNIKNHYIQPVNVFIKTTKNGKNLKQLTQILPEKTFNVPLDAVYSEPYEFYFQIEEPVETQPQLMKEHVVELNTFCMSGKTISYENYKWIDLIHKDSNFPKKIHCTNRNGGPGVMINIQGSTQDIFWFDFKSDKKHQKLYTLDIRPVMVLKNCLPVPIFYTLNDENAGDWAFIDRGESGHLQNVRYGETKIHLQIFGFRDMDWICSRDIEENMAELSTWRFQVKTESNLENSNEQAKLDLRINSIISHGTHVLSIYSPFWMINKTGKTLTYKDSQDSQNNILHPYDQKWNEVPMMFSYTKRFLGKRKACLQIEDSQWSDAFTLDTIEDAGKVSCKTKNSLNQIYHVGVQINMSKSSLTKIITFTPFYLLHNTMDHTVQISEAEQLDQSWMDIGPGKMVPFWPQFGSTCPIFVKIKGHPKTCHLSFSLNKEDSTLLMLKNQYGGIHVEVKASVSETLVTFSAYKRGLAPVQLINHTKSHTIMYGEKGIPQPLPPGQSIYYTWIVPESDRILHWSFVGTKKKHEFENSLQSDGGDFIQLGPDQILTWVSFLDGMQRVLLFTDDYNLGANLAHTTGEFERIAHEIDINIFGIGISLVNNTLLESNHEILYMSITSSDVVWELRRGGKNRYKPLTKSQCEAIEKDYNFYTREKSIGKRTHSKRNIVTEKETIVVDYDEEKMFSPHEGSIKRQFQKGLWLQVRDSDHQRQIHAKINRVQIDNQLTNCWFPVVLAPVPPPKSVLADSIPKPFMELSVLQYRTEHTNMAQYKYVSALVQEAHLKVDQGLIDAIMEFLEPEKEILDEDINEFLKEDLALAEKPLSKVATLRVSQGQKDFFDYLHLSPLKVHVSFSLTSYKSSMKNSNRRSNLFALFLQSLGTTITDIDDVIFRLAYFERKHHFSLWTDVLQDVQRHYTSQVVKQGYVLLFGLDVIGNPFGLVVGVTRSVEDLFYEPFQGAVEGPSEFAEGLVIGVRSVFSGVVGGAAGTVSRITGALGKGIASLTFDSEFQRKRRDAIKKRGKQNFGESLARSSKGLAMGIFEGVTGVAMKPIEGAKQEGVGGFFKGMGKGVVGLVARPTGGIVDFASGTFDSVKRVTETSQEIGKKRPARFLKSDGITRPYNLFEAEGWKFLRDLEKGKYSESDTYVTHEEIPSDNRHKEVFLVTNKRILVMNYQTVLGSWSIDWQYLITDITGPPTCGELSGKYYINFKPKNEKKSSFMGGVFGGSDDGKIVFINARESAKQVARIVEDIRTSSQN